MILNSWKCRLNRNAVLKTILEVKQRQRCYKALTCFYSFYGNLAWVCRVAKEELKIRQSDNLYEGSYFETVTLKYTLFKKSYTIQIWMTNEDKLNIWIDPIRKEACNL